MIPKRMQVVDMDNTVILGDCVDVLQTIHDKSVDMICIDPPYEIDYAEWDGKNTLNWDFLSTQFKRILTDRGSLIIFQGWSNVCKTQEIVSKQFHLKNWIIYDRIKGRGTKNTLVSTREDILWYTNNPDQYTFNKIPSTIRKKTTGMGLKNGCEFRALSNVWSDISPIVPWSRERNIHPTQKPLQLMERIVTLFSNPNDIVLDCFAGSGSTLVASKNLGRSYVGIERDPIYYEICKDRLNDPTNDFY